MGRNGWQEDGAYYQRFTDASCSSSVGNLQFSVVVRCARARVVRRQHSYQLIMTSPGVWELHASGHSTALTAVLLSTAFGSVYISVLTRRRRANWICCYSV